MAWAKEGSQHERAEKSWRVIQKCTLGISAARPPHQRICLLNGAPMGHARLGRGLVVRSGALGLEHNDGAPMGMKSHPAAFDRLSIQQIEHRPALL